MSTESHEQGTDGTAEGLVDGDRRVGRRALLRRAGTVVAVAGGAAAAGAAMSGSAQAASGDPVLQGSTNNAGTASTTITAASTADATLVIESTGTRGAVRLLPSDVETLGEPNLQSGELFQVNGDLFYVPVGEAEGGPIPSLVFNELTALQLVPIIPKRVLDTRSAGGRARIVDWTHDGSNRLLAGQWLTLDLSDLGDFFDAVVGNLAVTGTADNGFAAMAPAATGGAAATATINYTKGQTLSNGFTSAVNTDDGTIAVWSQQSTHVIIDLMAFNTPGPSWIHAPQPATASVRGNALRAAVQRRAQLQARSRG